MKTTFAGGTRPMKRIVAPFAAAALCAAGCSVDATKFTCTNSGECPTGYHCDMGTATTAGSFKCANGAPQQKTLTVDATKFILSQQSFADGTVRTTITGEAGAVTGAPDLVGVRAIASQSGAELGSGRVLADGSVLAFQLAQAGLQVDLKVQDDSGHSVPVTGYNEHLELNFAGKNVSGTKNGAAAFDALSVSDSLFPPATWITSGGVTGTPLAELPATYNVLSDGGISPPASYQALADLDGVNMTTGAASQPDRDGGTPIGWEQLGNVSTATFTATNPTPRAGAAIANDGSRIVMYGGAAPDVDGGIVDAAGTWYQFTANPPVVGWASVEQPSTTSIDPRSSVNFGSPGVGAPTGRASAAIGANSGSLCSDASCSTLTRHDILVAGGTNSSGGPTDHIYAFGNKVLSFPGGSTNYRGWWDLTVEFGNTAANKLPVANAGMAYASMNVNAPVGGNTLQTHTGILLVGGNFIAAGAGGTAWDSIGCQAVFGIPRFTPTNAGQAGTVFNCTTAEFATAAGALGFRTGVALAPSDQQDGVVYLFGGNRAGATTTTLNGLKNDLWVGIIDVVCNPGGSTSFPCTAGTTAQSRARWQQVTVAGTARPSARTNAGLTFADNGRLTVVGGTDAAGNNLTDVWELDITQATPTWQQVALDAAPALAPSARSKFTFTGWNFFYNSYYTAFLVGGIVGSSPTLDVWALSKQAPSRLLIKAPVSIPKRDVVQNLNLSVLSFGPSTTVPLYIWDGSMWRFVTAPNLSSRGLLVTIPNASGYIQPDGNVYLMYMHRSRATAQFANTSTVALDSVQVFVDFN